MRVRKTNGQQMYLERLLHEFPWLWAVQPRWVSHLDRVEIKTVNLEILRHTYADLGFRKIWVKVRRPYGGTWLLEAHTRTSYRNLAGYILQQAQKLGEGDYVEALALIKHRYHNETCSSHVTVYREKRVGDFKQLCFEAIKGLPKNKPLDSDTLFMLADRD